MLLAEAGWRLELDRTIVVPTGEAWHKDSAGSAPGQARLSLAEKAFGTWAGVEVSGIEVDREGPSYTCETLELIQSANPDSQIFLLTGSDTARGIGNWHRPERVLEMANFAVAPRSGADRESVSEVFEGLGAGDRLEFFEMPEVGISSTLVRERIGAGRPWKHLVPHEVAEMIDNEDLYGRKQ
ncbi:MAG: nicotinate-nucleotide adenylyltransferase [Actinomycetota bacterium]|nr:nicotinate-nucleotide adenylyltransferase [Actinomycetota bacterium]